MAAASPMSLGSPPGKDDDDDFSASDLTSPASQSTAPATQQERSKGVVAQIKGLHSQIDDLARQFPAGSKELRKAQDAIKDAMVKILSDMQRPSQGGPPVG